MIWNGRRGVQPFTLAPIVAGELAPAGRGQRLMKGLGAP
jgi:hypothetical protein